MGALLRSFPARLMSGHHLLAFACTALALMSCRDSQPLTRTPLPHRAYVWQREWTPAVSTAVQQSTGTLEALVPLGSEIVWRKEQPKAVRASIDWRALSRCALALRVAPHAVPFEEASAAFILQEAQHLLATAKEHGVVCTELQLDFDCAEKKLAGYQPLVARLRKAIQPMPLVITTLPVWLDEPEFPALIAAADRYVLQVHSVQPVKPGAQVAICDPERARRSVEQAAKLGREFEVALPTYSALVAIGPNDRVVGYAFEGEMPDWPAGTRVVPYRVEPDDMADLVRQWNLHRPAHLRGILWFRLPVATDTRNWTWNQLAAVTAGRPLRRAIAARTQGTQPVDILLVNEGEASHPLVAVKASWPQGRLVASEALPGWSLHIEGQTATYRPATDGSPANASGERRRVIIPTLPPGAQRSIGWLRFDQPASVHVQIER